MEAFSGFKRYTSRKFASHIGGAKGTPKWSKFVLVLEALIDAVLLSAVIFPEDAAQVEISSIRITASSVFNNLTTLNINVLGKKLCMSFLCKVPLPRPRR